MFKLEFFSTVFLLVAGLFYSSQDCAAINWSKVWQTAKKFQLGVDLSTRLENLDVEYQTQATPEALPLCDRSVRDDSQLECKAIIPAGTFSGYDFFIQPEFTRQGFFYFDFGGSAAIRNVRGKSVSNLDPALPLKSLSTSLYGLVLRFAFTFGITPEKYFPDLLFSLGPSLQVLMGKVTVNDTTRAVNAFEMVELQAFAEWEIVLWRFYDGSLSIFANAATTNASRGNKLISDEVDGMRDIRAKFDQSSSGIKLVLPIP